MKQYRLYCCQRPTEYLTQLRAIRYQALHISSTSECSLKAIETEMCTLEKENICLTNVPMFRSLPCWSITVWLKFPFSCVPGVLFVAYGVVRWIWTSVQLCICAWEELESRRHGPGDPRAGAPYEALLRGQGAFWGNLNSTHTLCLISIKIMYSVFHHTTHMEYGGFPNEPTWWWDHS